MAAVVMLMFGVGVSAAADHAAQCVTPSRPGASPPSFIAHHQLEAEVSNVDRDGGVLHLKTDAGRLKLDAPAPATAPLRKGDRVLVDITMICHPDPAVVPRDQGTPRPLLVQRVAAEVTGIKRSVGVASLNTLAGRLNVDLPSAVLAGLRTGDRLPLELAVRLESDVAALARTDARRSDAGLAALLFAIFGRPK